VTAEKLRRKIMYGKNLVFKLSLAAGAFLLWGANSLSAQQVFNCSSDDGHRHYCSAQTHHADVNMVKQHSDARCEEGYSWGRDHHGVWVDHGCRADFEIVRRDQDRDNAYRTDDYNRRQGMQAISCSSDDGGRHYCAADTRRGVRLFKQVSDARCEEGRSWGYDQRGIWVDHGCRADFQTGTGGR